jgi:hypothetical protein
LLFIGHYPLAPIFFRPAQSPCSSHRAWK